MRNLRCLLFPQRMRFSVWRPTAVFLSALLLVETVLFLAFGKTVPDMEMAADSAYFLAQLSAFLVPFAYYISCMRREPVLSLCPVASTFYNYVLPVWAAQLVYAVPAGLTGYAAGHLLVMAGMVFAVWGVDSFLRAAGLSLDLRRLAVLLLLLLALLDVILFNTVVERAGGARGRVVSAILAVNPAVAVASAYGRDIMRGPLLYHRSVIGQYYPFEYPAPFAEFLRGLVLGILLVALALLLDVLAGGRARPRSP